jgi:phosphoribosyl 1,2-cyclic phosphate phosphodiesterase
MKIKYLGTAAAEGIPALFCSCPVCTKAGVVGGKNHRTRTQVLIDDTIIIDFPPDSLMHAQREGIKLLEIPVIFVTHSHQDHWYPNDLLFRKPPYGWGVETPLQIFGNETVKQKFDALEFHKDELLSASVKMHLVEPFVPIVFGKYTVTPLLATHDKRERCYFYSIACENKCLLYAHDTGHFPEATNDFIKGTRFDVISMDCTMGSLKDGNNHMGLADNRQLVKTLRALGCLDEKTKIVVNHFSHNGGLLHEEIEENVKEDGFIVAYDSMTIEC